MLLSRNLSSMLALCAGAAILTGCGGTEAVAPNSVSISNPNAALNVNPSNLWASKTQAALGHETRGGVDHLRTDASRLPFLISSFATVYSADTKFSKLTPVQTAPDGSIMVLATAAGPGNTLFVANCTSMGSNPQEYYGGYDGPGHCNGGETDLYAPGSQPTVIPYGGSGVAVASNGRFATVLGGPYSNNVFEFKPGQTSPDIDVNTLGYPNPNWVSLDRRGKSVYAFTETTSVGQGGAFQFKWLKSAPTTFYFPSVGFLGYLAKSGTFYDIGPGHANGNGSECTGGNVAVFETRSQTPTYTITSGINCPIGVTEYKGSVYVANSGPQATSASVTVYPIGKTTPTKTHLLPWIPTSFSLSTVI